MKKSKKLKIFLIAVVCLVFMVLGILFCYNSETINFSKQNAQSAMVKSDSKVGTVKIKYVDTEGKSIASEESISGKVGEWYTTSRKKITSYRAYGDEPLNKRGYYSENQEVVEYIYERISSNAVTTIDEQNEITISVENQRTLSEYDFFVKTICSESNKSVNGAGLKIYKDYTEIKSGKTNNGELYVGTVTVKDETISTYSIEESDVADGYACNIDSKFDFKVIRKWNENQNKFEIKLEYDKSSKGILNVEVNSKNQIIVTLDYKNLLGNYSMNIVTKDSGTQAPVFGAKFKIRSLSSSYSKDVVIENEVENIGNFELSKETEVVEYYEIEQVEAAEGYDQILEEPIIIEVKKVYNPEKKKYDVEVVYDESLIYVEVIVGDDGTITIIVSCARNNNQDLGIEYFLNKINNKEIKDREPIITFDQENKLNEIIGKTDNISVENNDELNFIARVYNNSDSEVNGGAVKIAIPNGLSFDSNNSINIENEWKMYIEDEYGVLQETDDVNKANVVVSKKLTSQKIAAFNPDSENKISYLDLQLVLKVSEATLKDSRNIKDTAKLINLSKDLYEENNQNSEYLYVKYFDLGITKYIEKININVEDKTAVKEVGFNKKDTLTKIEVQAKKINATKLNIIYGIKVENIGEIAGIAQEITDFLPEGFTFNPSDNPDWYLDGNVLKTTILNSEILNPGESKTIYVNLEWKLNEEHIGARTNQAKVTQYHNESNSIDITEENISDSTVIVSIATGLAVYTGIVISISAIIAVGILVLKKYGRKE